ncbi:hypothetical protein OHA72_39235 [Dactylosporangium sp. NBC_01737]|uniref:hypothetical protein n=1 Tax=Dactylosporangium sp. NBC_01737 TaxID=2975959 RepID=UPI002E15900D|nr:hypothetical protein OHA72_39235 [Dactylosporangium sp. NBC_01737]
MERVARRASGSDRKLTSARALHLTIKDGNSIYALIENFDQGFLDRIKEDPSTLEELTQDAAGVTGALRTLEAIAAEGAAWIEEERKRRNRRLRDYNRRQRRRALGAAPSLDLGNLPRQARTQAGEIARRRRAGRPVG